MSNGLFEEILESIQVSMNSALHASILSPCCPTSNETAVLLR
jgi:hypothetical protein